MHQTNASINFVGAVVIGRNEGERLRVCLESVLSKIPNIVYVDSGSNDNSIDIAKKLNVDALELDLSVPFTAARARNTGFGRLIELWPDTQFAHFVDGDCELDMNWVSVAHVYLVQHRDVAVVCGRRRERFPEKSIYNLLCDIEWDAPTGEVKYCGGDAMMRTRALSQVDGYREDLIAGEEPELCVRLRMAGWKISRIKAEMTLHDANMTSFYQWWRRAIRGGYAYAQGMAIHGGAPEYQNVRECLRIWFWGAILPVMTFLGVTQLGPTGMLILAIYPIQVIRITLKRGGSIKVSLSYACFMILGKFPEMWGQLRFYFNRILRVKARLIEYK